MIRSARKKTTPLVRLFFTLCAFPFMFVFPYFAATNNPNENTRTYMTMAIVEDGTFQLDNIVARQGWTNDMARVPSLVPGETAHWHCVKGPATGYLGVPFYFAFLHLAPHFGIEFPKPGAPPAVAVEWFRMTTWILRIFTTQLPCFLFLIWFERYLRDFTRDDVIRLSAVAAAGLGTNYLGYALMYVSHAVFAVAAFLCFGMIEREWRTRRDPKTRRPWIAFLVGLTAGWVTMLEYHGLPMSVVLTIFGFCVFWRPLRALSLAMGGVVTIGLQMLYQWRSFHNPFTPGHQMVSNPQWAMEHHRGVFGIILPSLTSIGGLSLPIGSGFFGMSPFMWLGVLAIVFLMWKPSSLRIVKVRRWSTFTWLTVMAVLWFAAGGALEWRAGWTLGPRRLGAAPPFFAFGAVCVLEWLAGKSPWMRSVARGAAGGLALVGVLASGLVGMVFNTLPEEIVRPLSQFALPLIRGGFVSHHVGEWFGATGTAFWYVCAAALVLAPLTVALAREHERRGPYILRVITFVGLFAIGIRPQFTEVSIEEGGARTYSVEGWTRVWEPSGRDRLTALREEAERYGPRRPCAWHKLADVERSMNLTADAARDDKRAGGSIEGCPRTWL